MRYLIHTSSVIIDGADNNRIPTNIPRRSDDVPLGDPCNLAATWIEFADLVLVD
jgi:hypothetical protein